ncbi:rab-GTPase-TBC domain-containing protein [Xylaria palmicola]|nr:rab-GTPase-TBC domain-containing protein [Xylaria palmicola]
MIGAAQGGVAGSGTAAPPANYPSPQLLSAAAPNNHSGARHRHSKEKRYTAPAPFRDDTRLIALRYDQTVALEPPIPLPPPRSPLRAFPRSSSLNLHRSAVARSPAPLVVAPPRRPPPPAEQHPALRTISTPRSFDSSLRRDSPHASSPSTRSYRSRAHAHYAANSSRGSSSEDDEDDDDPFAYETIDKASGVRPLALRPASAGSSIYSRHERQRAAAAGHGRDRGYTVPPPAIARRRDGAGEGARVSEASLSPSPALSVGSTASPTLPASPATPPPQFSKRFARSFSFRSGPFKSSSSTASMKRLRKKPQPAEEDDGMGEGNVGHVNHGRGNSGHGNGQGNGHGRSGYPQQQHYQHYQHPQHQHQHPGTHPSGRPSGAPATGAHPHTTTATSSTVRASAGQSSVGPASPAISTTIPCESFFEEDDLSKLSFSIRGSLIFGGKRPWKTSASSQKMADRDAIAEQPQLAHSSSHHSHHSSHHGSHGAKARVFPLVPPKKDHVQPGPPPTRPPRQDDMGVAAMIQQPFQLPDAPLNDTASTTARTLPPSIRVISAEAEKESQKVRSLYESGELLPLDVPWPPGQTLEPPPKVSSDADGHDAPNDRARGPPTLMSASTSSLAPHGNHELAGGIEDWEGVEGRDVDRYGFIVPHQPDSSSPPGTASAAGSSPVRFSSRKHRNVLARKDVTSLSLGAKRAPSRKLSARSLNTHMSEVSALSRRSVRSTIRQATNKLPHNKDRRLIDEAGDLLALQPGLSHATEIEAIEKISADLKRKELKRSEKWRKMAKVVRPGSEGQGTVFHFDVNNPKLIERTWKGIPDCWRSAAWYSFLATSAKAGEANYVSDEELIAAFRRLVGEPSPDDTQIDLDVPRTINQHIMFRRRYRGGQRLLFRVLHALSLYFPETGYVQGMAPLAATLLSYYEEEQCFIMLVRIWRFRGLNRIYQSGFAELIGALKDFETHWLNEKDVAEVLKELCIDPTAYATRWYLTLFNLSIPFPVQLRVWDVFMLLGSSPPEEPESSSGTGKEPEGHPSSQGLEILHATSLAIIDTLHATLIDSDFENAMKSLTSWVPIKDEQRFLEVVQIEWKKHQQRQKKKA